VTRPSGAPGDGEGLLGTLSTPPDGDWTEKAFHHGARFGLLLLLALAVTLFFPPSPGLEVSRYEVGMVADEDVIASIPFGVPKNREELEREREAAASAVPPTFEARPEAVEAMTGQLERFFRSVETAVEEEEPDRALAALFGDLGVPATAGHRARLRDPATRQLLSRVAEQAVRTLLPRGVMDEGVRPDPAQTRILLVEADGSERYAPRESVLTNREFLQGAADLLPTTAASEVDELLRLILIRHMTYSLRFDQASTQRDRDAARRAVPTTKANVLQGEAIVRANQQVGETEVERLQAYEEALRAQGRLEEVGFQAVPFLASIVLNLALLGVFGVFLFLFRGDIYGNFRWLLLQSALVLAFMGAAGILARNDLPSELLPIAFVALAVAVLWDGRVALILTAVLAAVVGTQLPFQSVHAWLPHFAGGAAAALSVRVVRRRAQTWIFIALIALAYLAVLATLGAVMGRDPGRIALAWSFAAGNTVVSAILAMGFLPVFEWFARITTDQTLLEWADPNRPLLKRLSMEAPGTYAHTINVANLAESAANAIGANGLLCRVGVYYHDVGKMLKPHFFIENQPGGRNPHDKLKPTTSATIVREHVTEGIRLAKEAKLPQVLVDFIPEHHGTQEISFFLEKARAELGEDEELDPVLFRYPGPRPRSRETAIVMLADTVESATRSMQEPTRERIRELIDMLVDAKIQARQLDEAPLTLRDIGVIKDAFEKVLAGLYHHRIDYPQTRHLTRSDGGGTPSGEGEGDAGVGAGAGQEGGAGRAGAEGAAKGAAKGPPADGQAKVPPPGAAAPPGTRLQTSQGTGGREGVTAAYPWGRRATDRTSEALPEPSLFPLDDPALTAPSAPSASGGSDGGEGDKGGNPEADGGSGDGVTSGARRGRSE
jgi:cyclic-di-AMP phosphodiesterase PgpH